MTKRPLKRSSAKAKTASRNSAVCRKIQQSLFDQIPKRGRPRLVPSGHFGGIYLKSYNPKTERPFDSKKAMHVVLRSSKAIGENSFKNWKNESSIWDIICRQAERTGVKIYEYANGGNHLHLLVRAKHRDEFNSFIRSITGLIARRVGKSEKGSPLKEKFWDARPFSRVVSFERKTFSAAKTYLARNNLEAIGWMPYIPRAQKVPKDLRAWLNTGVSA